METVQDDLKKSRELLGQLADMMPHNPSVKDVLQRVLWLARQLEWADSAAIFLVEDNKLVPEVFRSPYHHRLREAAPLGVSEPFIVRALKERSPLALTEEDRGTSQIFAGETQGLAVPIHDYGVLYLGRKSEDPYSESTLTGLVALCQQAHFALLVARLSGSRKALEHEERESRHIAETLLDSVSAVVEMMSEILALTSPHEVLECTGNNLFRMAEFEFWSIAAGESDESGTPEYFLTGTARPVSVNREAALGLCKIGISSGRTLSFMNMNRLSLPQPAPEIRSVLICPMLADGQTIGCLLLGSVRPCFSRHEREVLSTLALQVGSHFWNLHLHHQLKLSQAQLIQSSKMAAVGQLAAGVAHELNTPLGAMNLAIEGAVRVFEKKPDRALSRLERALKSGNQLKEIVSKLLNYSKQADAEGQETDLSGVARDALELIGHQLRLDNVEVRSELSEVPVIMANHNELQQVLINLFTNAKDAIVSAGVEQRLITVRTRSEGDTVQVSVEDNGTGMDKKTRDRAFEPFYTTKEVGSGTGLGLSVTKEIVERNQGTIEIDTELGRGTTITLKFNRYRD